MTTTPTPPLTLATAKAVAADDDNRNAWLAAGRVSNAVDRLLETVMANTDHDDRQKEAYCDKIVEQLKATMLSAARRLAIGDGSPDPSRSGDEDGDLLDRLGKAEAAKAKADDKAARVGAALKSVLDQIGQALGGVSIPINADGSISANIADMITIGLTEAKRQGMSEIPNAWNSDVDNHIAVLEAVKASPLKGGEATKKAAIESAKALKKP